MSEVRTVVVAGSGIEAWIAAAGLRRAFREQPLEVTVVGAPVSTPCVARWTLPSQRGMHALLGLAEAALMVQSGATFKLASEHAGWQGKGSRFVHAHGEIGTAIGDAPFYKLLLSEALAGRPHPADAYSLAGTAARLGRFARPMGDEKSITAGFTYAFHLDETAYTQTLRAHALALGVREAPGAFADVVLGASGDIEQLRLADGSAIAGDYFIDCSGPAAILLSRVSSAEREDWSRWLPCDRMLSAQAPPMTDPPPVTQTEALAAGWAWRVPLARSSAVGYVYSSRFLDDAGALAALRGFEPRMAAPVLARFSSGRRRQCWARNCVALGETAVELEPLAGAGLHMAQVGLATFLELFPLVRASTIEADEYNRLIAQHADALRDFTLAHYAGATRRGDLWDAVRAERPPERLAHKLDLYAANGRINLLDHETFEETDWAWLMIGSGRIPDALELQIRLALDKIPPQALGGLRAHIQQLVATMPPHGEYLRHLSRGAGGRQ